MNSIAASDAPPTERRGDLDTLRVLIVFGIVFFHTLRIFDLLDWAEGVKNAPGSLFATIITGFFSIWGMPVMFVIAGFGVWHSLRKRTALQFVRERVERLLVPLIFGVLIFVPWQLYFHLKQTDPTFALSYWQYLGRFFAVVPCRWLIPLFVCADPAVGWFGTAHLWFLRYLLVLSVLLLPVFLLFLRTARGAAFLRRLNDFLARPWAVLLLALPLSLVEVAFRVSSDGGWNVYAYGLLLLYGFLFAADRRYWAAMGSTWKGSLAVGLLGCLGYIAGGYFFSLQQGIDVGRGFDAGSIAWRTVQGIAGWAMILAVLGIGARPRAATTRPQVSARGSAPSLRRQVMAYAGQAFLPIYIIHQSVIVLIGYYVVQWPIAGVLKYALISLSSLALSLLIYDFAVRRTPVTRWMFGMKAARPAKAEQSGRPVGMRPA